MSGKLKKAASNLPEEFEKSVQAIEARLNFNYLEQCIFDTSLATVKDVFVDGHVRKGFSFYAKDLPGFITSSGSAYAAAHKAANNVRTAMVLYKPRSGSFVMINVFSSIAYENGRFAGFFTDEAVKCGIVSPENNYLKVKAGYNIFASDELYAWRLSEFLKDRVYQGREKDGYYHRQISIHDLRSMLGLVNTQSASLIDELSEKKESFNIDDMVDALIKEDKDVIKPQRKKAKAEAKKKKIAIDDLELPQINVQYPDFGQFKLNVLDPAIETINQKKILKIYECEFQTVSHGKIAGVDFKFDTVVDDLPERELNEMMKDMDEYLVNIWTLQQRKELLKAANYDAKMVKEKYEYMLSYKEYHEVVDDFRFTLDAIKRDYKTQSVVEEPESTPFDNVFTKVWDMYPKSTRKDLVRKKNIKEIEDIGYDNMKAALNNYIKSVQMKRENGFKKLAYMSGGAFFSGAYQDYLPENFEKTMSEDMKVMKQSNNTFNSFAQRDTDYDAIVQERIMNRSMA